MIKKVGVLLLALFFTSFFVIAQNNGTNNVPASTNNVEKAYQCLENLIDDKDQDDISLQEAVFSNLALGSNSKLKSVIDAEKGNNCWPSSSCTIKDTAQVLLAFERTKKNTDDIETWLLDQAGVASELTWFLQIDIENHELIQSFHP